MKPRYCVVTNDDYRVIENVSIQFVVERNQTYGFNRRPCGFGGEIGVFVVCGIFCFDNQSGANFRSCYKC